MRNVTQEQPDWTLVIPHVTALESPSFRAGEWSSGPNEFPVFVYSDELSKLVQDLYDCGIVYDFDWGAWQDTAIRLFETPSELDKADLNTLRKLLTTHVRKDRFCEGHLVEMVTTGHIAAILSRAAVVPRQYCVRAKSFDAGAIAGDSMRDASRRSDGRGDPIRLVDTPRPAARDPGPAPSAGCTRPFESTVSRF